MSALPEFVPGRVDEVNQTYLDWVRSDLDGALTEYRKVQQGTADAGVLYDGRPIPYPFKPHFVTETQDELMRTTVEEFLDILEHFITIWLKDKELQGMWHVSPEEIELYKVDPGYERAIQVSRLDALLSGYTLQYLEFNCDSPGGNGDADIINREFVASMRRAGLDQRLGLVVKPNMLQLDATVEAVWNEWRNNRDPSRPERPYVVATDWRDGTNTPDIMLNVEHLRERGYDADFADPRDFELQDDGLYLDGRRVDVVYKRVIVKELLADDKTKALRDAYRRQLICMFNPPRSVIPGNKKILAALRLTKVFRQFSKKHQDTIRTHVPWTEILRPAMVDYKGHRVDLRSHLLEYREKFVLKASRSYGGKDVLIGFSTDPKTWKETIDKHIDDGEWIVQELVDIPSEDYPVEQDGRLKIEDLYVNVNPLAFNGKYVGAYCRVSTNPVINVSHGGGMLPAITVKDRLGP